MRVTPDRSQQSAGRQRRRTADQPVSSLPTPLGPNCARRHVSRSRPARRAAPAARTTSTDCIARSSRCRSATRSTAASSVRLSDEDRGLCRRAATAAAMSASPARSRRRSARPAVRRLRRRVATSNPGIVLPVYICSAGTNCADGGRPPAQPEQPLCRRLCRRPDQRRGAHLLSVRRHRRGQRAHQRGVSRHRRPERHDRRRLELAGRGRLCPRQSASSIQHGLAQHRRRCARRSTPAPYNFVNPSLNSAGGARLRWRRTRPRRPIRRSTRSTRRSRPQLLELPGGPLQLAVGGQVASREAGEQQPERRARHLWPDHLARRSASTRCRPAISNSTRRCSTSLDVNVSGRYDHYSEGFGRFSPKIGVKFTPIRQFAIRGTYSQGFRAPTFAEIGPRSQYAGFVDHHAAGALLRAHGGTDTPAPAPTAIRTTCLFGRPRLRRQSGPAAREARAASPPARSSSRRAGSASRSTITT